MDGASGKDLLKEGRLKEAVSKEVSKEGKGEVESHMFVIECTHKHHTPTDVPPSEHTPHSRQHESQTDAVVLEVFMIDQHQPWL